MLVSIEVTILAKGLLSGLANHLTWVQVKWVAKWLAKWLASKMAKC